MVILFYKNYHQIGLDHVPICGQINSPEEIFDQMKTESVLLPVKASDRKLGKKFHSCEKTIIHPERNVERLPTNNFKILEDPPFKLQSGYVRNCIRCSNKDCRKPRLIFKQKKASKNEMNEFLNQ